MPFDMEIEQTEFKVGKIRNIGSKYAIYYNITLNSYGFPQSYPKL